MNTDESVWKFLQLSFNQRFKPFHMLVDQKMNIYKVQLLSYEFLTSNPKVVITI